MDHKERFIFDECLDYVFISFFKIEAKLQQVSFNLQ